MAARREKRKLAKNPPVTKYNLDPTTPIHRQSLATTSAPAMVETKEPKSTPQLHYAILDQPQRSELPLNRNKSEHKGQSDWMVPFCHNPVGDHKTAFTGIFAPCVLYGKTHRRLKHVSLGRDPHDFKSSDGCNSMCWIHGALTVACCLSIGLTVIQRARIRAQYRIQGSMGNDIIKSSFCGPCAMMQHDREVRAREGDVGLAKDFGGPQMSQIQPKAPQPMRYALPRSTSAEDPRVENRIFKQGQRRYTDSELQEVPAVAVSCAEGTNCQTSNGHRSENCVEALKDHMLMEPYRRAINSSNAGANVAKIDGATSSQQKTRVGSEKKSLDTDSPIPSLYEHHLKVKGCEKLSRMPARGHLSYVHDFSDYSATKIVLDHYAEEERRLQEKGIVRCLAHFSKEKLNQLGSNNAATQSIRSSSSSTIRQHTSQEGAVETPPLDLVNKSGTDSCATGSVDAAWLLDLPAQHRISSCSVIPEDTASVQKSPRQHRIVSCPTTPGTPVTDSSASSTAKDRALYCTVEAASSSGSSSSALHNEVPATKMDIMEDSDLSTPLIQYSQYCHLLDESTLKSDSPIHRSSSRCRASSCTALSPAREQPSKECCSALSGNSSPILVKQHRISSCYASIPSSSSKSLYGENDSRLSGDCSFTTGSSTPLAPKQQIFASYTAESSSVSRKSSSSMGHLMEDGCLLSGAASPIKQHRVASCGDNVGGQNYINTKNNFGNGYISSGSTTPKPRQHRAVSCIASSAISECEEHLFDDCEFDSKIASPLLQHNLAGCDTTSVSAKEQGHLLTVFEEEQQHLLEDCAADSSPSSPLRQHRIASCVISSPSSNRSSVVKQHRVASCPDIILNEGSGAQRLSPDSHHLPRDILVDASENDQSTHTNYEDCLHTLDECITPADRAKMEANASRATEYKKYSMKIANHFNDQATGLNEKSAEGEEVRRPRLNDFASHESDAQFTLAQVLSLDQENPMISVTRIDGDGTRSIASRGSVAPPVPFPSPAAPYPSPITPFHISGAYPPSIPSLSNKKDKRRIPSEQSSAGSGFASYFGFGNTKKAPGLVIGIGGSRRKVIRSRVRVRCTGVGIVEPVSMEELELEEILL
ncbi:31e98ed8-0f5e-4a77-904a-3c1bc6c7f538 [Sclerotinia trifoliorum]|uniref:31e98ed8-0f5e-4a77-904a-3c1bc6c7f538 n=1 Tax=Sclerotinia trifoliorum TaxID=28548 RepID=A0A8H2ZJW8_9HELO|nr:31e98ed8-0f5e-4a77-904a-3c1bc6c7f538 [Sclerotinia trifoliorum]